MSKLFRDFYAGIEDQLQNEPLFDLFDRYEKKNKNSYLTIHQRELEVEVEGILTKINITFDRNGYPIESTLTSEKVISETEKKLNQLEKDLKVAINLRDFMKAHEIQTNINKLK